MLYSFEQQQNTVEAQNRLVCRRAGNVFWDERNAHQPQTKAAQLRIVGKADGSVACVRNVRRHPKQQNTVEAQNRLVCRRAGNVFWDERNAHQPQTKAAQLRIVGKADGSVVCV